MERSDLRIIAPQNCGNSPRMNFIKELNIKMAKEEFQFFYDHLTDDFEWNILGDQIVKGKENAIEVMEGKRMPIVEIEFLSIISHGTAGAVNGAITLDDNVRYAYCSIYTFTSTSKNFKIKEMTTYFHMKS